jgi:hypothetical protein
MLIQVVPQRSVEPNGVADYALALARALREYNGTGSIFLSSACAVPVQDEWDTVSLPQRRGQVLADAIRSLTAEVKAQAVLLHFSGYGYQMRGVPLWLANGLQIWRRHEPHVPLLTIFHELYATNRPWRSAFWLSPIQKQIARRILHLSSTAVTPTKLYSKRLLHWANGGERKVVTSLPVFSNVGEPGCGPSPCARGATAVVFGLAGVEDRLFGVYRTDVERIVSALEVEKIIDIGPRFSSLPSTLAGIPVISKGVLPQSAVSDLLQQARFGFVAYPLDVIAKSGVFAAYAAHGVVPVVLSEQSRLVSFDGVRPGQHFLDGLSLTTGVGADQLTSIQRELFNWYTLHSTRAQADFLTRSITRKRVAQVDAA